jgi:serine/threonine protein phosphatase PrpC
MSSDDRRTRFWFAQDMREPEHVGLQGGSLAIASRRCPGKDTDNEDAVVVVPIDESRLVLAVADGMGGLPAGEHASREALRSFVAALDTAIASGAGLREAVLDGFEAANRRVVAMVGAGGTTLAAVEIDGAAMRCYHVGDSAALLVGQRGKLKHLTIAHSPVGYAVEAGLLDEDEAMAHAERHLVSNVIGDRDMKIEVGPTIAIAERDTLLLASDGLFDNLRQDEITAAIRKGPLDAAARELLERSHARMVAADGAEPCKPDDLTFVLFRRA